MDKEILFISQQAAERAGKPTQQCLGGTGGGSPVCHATWADRPRSEPQEAVLFGEAEALVPQGLSLFQRDCANSNPGVSLQDELGPNLHGALCTLTVVTSCQLPQQCLKSRGEACLPASYTQQLAPTPPCLHICLDEGSRAWIGTAACGCFSRQRFCA